MSGHNDMGLMGVYCISVWVYTVLEKKKREKLRGGDFVLRPRPLTPIPCLTPGKRESDWQQPTR